MYDLSSLSLFDDNYELTSTDGCKRFVLSVCASLVHARGMFVCILLSFSLYVVLTDTVLFAVNKG